jgi:hypothetical protein
MKRREVAKHERRNGIQAWSSAIHAALRAGDFRGVWLFEPAAAGRPREIHHMVAISLYFDWHGNRMGDVPFFALSKRLIENWIDETEWRTWFLSEIVRDLQVGHYRAISFQKMKQ